MASVMRTPVAVNTPRRLLSRSTSNAPELLEAQLMLDDDVNRPLLDFSDMVTAVNAFQRKFKSYTEHAITTISDEKVDFDSSRVQFNNQMQAIDQEIEAAKSNQKQLWDTIRQEREADAQVRSRIQALTAQRASLSQRCTEIQTEISEARAKLEARKKAKQAQRDRFKLQIDQNGPELDILQTRTGCSILPTKVGDQMRFTFNLVNPEDWAEECFFVIDVSKPEYSVVSHAPELAPAVFEALTSELQKTRKFYTFVKKMRKALKEQNEKRRIEEREAARKA